MKILIVNTSDGNGGAARAAYRLHRSLIKKNIDSQMLVQRKSSDDYSVIGPETKIQKAMLAMKIRSKLDQYPVKLYKNRTKTIFSPAWVPLSSTVDKINELSPDIVHLHFINAGMLRIEDMENINAPVVMSLHDMWAFTGGCHYNEECEGYKKSCGTCKVLGSNKVNDLSRKIFIRKQNIFLKMENMTIIGLSHWLESCAKESTLFKDKAVVHLPNPIDVDTFRPINKEVSRELWNLPKNKKLVLFGAMGATSDPRKGFIKLSEALHRLEDKNIEFVVFGSSEPKEAQNFGYKTHYLGQLTDEVSLVTLYNAVDVMVVPSIQENLSNAIMESLACATPVVGFNIGGNSDMIEHKKNGYLVDPYDISDLTNGIEWILNALNYNELCQYARDKVLQEFDSVVVSKKYIKLYKEILNK